MSGRVALVTGGAGGIGAAICDQLVADGVGGIAVELDVTDPDSVAAAVDSTVDRLGPVEVCVSCAGWDELRPFLETDEPFQTKVLEINLAGPIRVTRAVLPHMVARSWGRIVTVASDAGRVGSSLESVYSGAKGGVIAFTKTIAREFARHGVIANTVCPGPTDTPLWTRSRPPAPMPSGSSTR